MSISIPTLATTRLTLRPFVTGDLDQLTNDIFADAEVMRYMPKADILPRPRAERALRYNDAHWQRHGFGKWAVTSKPGGEFMGYVGLNVVEEAGGEVEVEYGLAQPYWGKGIATEAARAALAYGLDTVNIERIIGLVVPENVASCRVLEHLGLTYERDVHYFGLDLRQYGIRRSALSDAGGGQP